jgi:hypothetical protein
MHALLVADTTESAPSPMRYSQPSPFLVTSSCMHDAQTHSPVLSTSTGLCAPPPTRANEAPLPTLRTGTSMGPLSSGASSSIERQTSHEVTSITPMHAVPAQQASSLSSLARDQTSHGDVRFNSAPRPGPLPQFGLPHTPINARHLESSPCLSPMAGHRADSTEERQDSAPSVHGTNHHDPSISAQAASSAVTQIVHIHVQHEDDRLRIHPQHPSSHDQHHQHHQHEEMLAPLFRHLPPQISVPSEGLGTCRSMHAASSQVLSQYDMALRRFLQIAHPTEHDHRCALDILQALSYVNSGNGLIHYVVSLVFSGEGPSSALEERVDGLLGLALQRWGTGLDVDLNTEDDEYSETPFTSALTDGFYRIAATLARHGAAITQPDAVRECIRSAIGRAVQAIVTGTLSPLPHAAGPVASETSESSQRQQAHVFAHTNTSTNVVLPQAAHQLLALLRVLPLDSSMCTLAEQIASDLGCTVARACQALFTPIRHASRIARTSAQYASSSQPMTSPPQAGAIASETVPSPANAMVVGGAKLPFTNTNEETHEDAQPEDSAPRQSSPRLDLARALRFRTGTQRPASSTGTQRPASSTGTQRPASSTGLQSPVLLRNQPSWQAAASTSPSAARATAALASRVPHYAPRQPTDENADPSERGSPDASMSKSTRDRSRRKRTAWDAGLDGAHEHHRHAYLVDNDGQPCACPASELQSAAYLLHREAGYPGWPASSSWSRQQYDSFDLTLLDPAGRTRVAALGALCMRANEALLMTTLQGPDAFFSSVARQSRSSDLSATACTLASLMAMPSSWGPSLTVQVWFPQRGRAAVAALLQALHARGLAPELCVYVCRFVQTAWFL